MRRIRSSGRGCVRRRNPARQGRRGAIWQQGPSRPGAPASLINGRGLHRDWLYGDMHRGSSPKPSSSRGGHSWSIDGRRARMTVKYHIAHCWVQSHGGQSNARRQSAGGNGSVHRNGKAAAPYLQPEMNASLETGWGLNTPQQTQGIVDFRVYGHCKLPSCSSKAASACRARYRRERMVDSVVLRTPAISAVDSSFTAESSKTSRSLTGRVSMSPRIRP
jgi:hypothetical protein